MDLQNKYHQLHNVTNMKIQKNNSVTACNSSYITLNIIMISKSRHKTGPERNKEFINLFTVLCCVVDPSLGNTSPLAYRL
jgi:hypothetical protein